MNRVLLLIAVAVLSATAIMARNVTVVPYPDDVVISDGTFNAAGAGFRYDAGFDKLAKDAVLNLLHSFRQLAESRAMSARVTPTKGLSLFLTKNFLLKHIGL